MKRLHLHLLSALLLSLAAGHASAHGDFKCDEPKAE